MGPVLRAVWDARGVEATGRHLEIEARFREIVEEAELDAPDEVGYEPESVVFYWHEPKLAVFVDFDDDSTRR